MEVLSNEGREGERKGGMEGGEEDCFDISDPGQVGDTECSSTLGPLQAVEMFYKRKPDAFIGPVCPYVLAPVVR